MEIIRKKIIGKDYNYPLYSTKENGILSITDAVLGNIGLYVRSNKIIYNYNLMQIEGTNPINLNIVYFSNVTDKSSSIQTRGFKFNYEQKVEKVKGTNYFNYYDGNNIAHTFKIIKGTGNKYYDENNPSGLILTLISSDYTYEIEDPKGNKLIFDMYGYLTKIERQTYSKKLNTIISYENNKIKSIQSDNNEEITFTYNIGNGITIKYGEIERKIEANTNNLIITKGKNKIKVTLNTIGLINKIEEVNQTPLVSILDTITFNIENNNIYTKIIKEKKASSTAIPSRQLYEYNIRKDNKLYEIIYKEEDISTKTEYIFNNDGTLSVSYQPTDTELFGVTNIKEYIERKNQIKQINPYNYFHKYLYTNQTIYNQGTIEIPLSGVTFPETEIFSLIYDLFYTAKTTNCKIQVNITLNNRILSSQIIDSQVGDDLKYEGIINFTVPVEENYNRKDLTSLKLNIIMENNQNGNLRPLEIYIYAHNNVSKGILIDVNNASNLKYQIKETESKIINGYLFNGLMKIEEETIYLTQEEIKFNQRECLKAISNNKTTFIFHYNNFANCKEMNVDFICCFINENGEESVNVPFNKIRIFSYQKTGKKITLQERSLTNYQRIDIIKNQIKNNQVQIANAFYNIKNDEYITTMSEKEKSIMNNYDSYGNLLSSSEVINYYASIRTEYSYNEKNNQIKESSFSLKGNRDIEYEYNNKNEITTIIDEIKHQTNYQINEENLITSVKEKEEETTLENLITYNNNKTIKTIVSPSKNKYTFTYDEYGNIENVKINTKEIIKEEITYPEGINGKVLTITYPNNQQMKFTYDRFNRLVEVASKENGVEKRIITKIYCDYIKGKALENVGDPFDSALVVSQASKLRKVIEYTDSFVFSYKYYYDYMSRLTRIEKIGLYNIYYYYNDVCEVERVERTFNKTDTNKMILSTEYLPETGLTSQLLEKYTIKYIYNEEEDTYQEQYVYDEFERIKEINTNKIKYQIGYESQTKAPPSRGTNNNYLVNKYVSSINEEIYQQEEISYDLKGNITEINGLKNVKYTYDEINRLTSEEDETSITKYSYDTKGRLISIIKRNKNEEILESKNFTYNITSNYDQIEKINEDIITYDENDNIKEYQGIKYLYQQGHCLKRILDEENDIGYEYIYNENGIRKEKRTYQISTNETIETKEYILEGDKILKENVFSYKDSTKNKTIIYLYGTSGVEGFILKNQKYYYIKNVLGDVIAIIDENNNIKVKYEYDAYGNIKEILLDNTFKDLNSFTYRSYYFDRESNLYYLINRYYNPSIGIFISPDSYSYLEPASILGLNLYAYCGFNPVMCRLGYNLGGGISVPISNISSISSNISSRSNSSSDRSMSRVSTSSTPFANVVSMTNYSTTLVDNILFGMALGNISHTITTQHNNSGVFYAYSNIGNSTSSVGVGLNIKDWYGLNAYVSSNVGIGSSMQLGSITFGAEVSVLDGVSFSFGTVTGNVTNETTVSIGWGTLAFAYAACGLIAATPVPFARVVAGVAVCVVVLIDLFN